MRNCLYNGPATRWLKEAASRPAFLKATGGSLDPKTMRDREAINRFCAFFQFGPEAYQSGDMDGFLARTLENMNGTDGSHLNIMLTAFERSMEINRSLFGKHAFRKSLVNPDPECDRTVINIALFDVCSVIFSEYDSPLTDDHAHGFRAAMRLLIEDEQFTNAITYSTNSTRQVHARFHMAREAIEMFS